MCIGMCHTSNGSTKEEQLNHRILCLWMILQMILLLYAVIIPLSWQWLFGYLLLVGLSVSLAVTWDLDWWR